MISDHLIGIAALLLLSVLAMIKLQAARPVAKRSRMSSRRLSADEFGARMTGDLCKKTDETDETVGIVGIVGIEGIEGIGKIGKIGKIAKLDKLDNLMASFNSAARETQQLLDRIGREEAELATRGNLLRTIFDGAPEAVALLDARARFQKINRAGLAMFDAESAATLADSALYRFVAPEHLAPLRALVASARAGAGGQIEIALCGAGGRPVRAEVHLIPLPQGPAASVTLLAIIREVPERIRREGSLRLLQAAAVSSGNRGSLTGSRQLGRRDVPAATFPRRPTGSTTSRRR